VPVPVIECSKTRWLTIQYLDTNMAGNQHFPDIGCPDIELYSQSTSEYRTVYGFQIEIYASTGHLKTRPFEIQTFCPDFKWLLA
jgi:hypothetical protein